MLLGFGQSKGQNESYESNDRAPSGRNLQGSENVLYSGRKIGRGIWRPMPVHGIPFSTGRPGKSTKPLIWELGWINLEDKRTIHGQVMLHKIRKEKSLKSQRKC